MIFTKRATFRHLAIVVFSLFLASSVFATSAAYDKGFADGKNFGMRAGKKKGYAKGVADGKEDGYRKGMADAEAGMNNPGPTPTPSHESDADNSADDSSADDNSADDSSADDNSAADSSAGPRLSGKLSSTTEETLTEEALRKYPDLLPVAPDLGDKAADLAVDPSAGTMALGGLIGDQDIENGTEYSKGFALGYMEGYKLTYNTAYDEGYPVGYAEGYAKGQKEYKNLHYDANGNELTPEQQYRIGRALLLKDKLDDAIVRFDLVLDNGLDDEWTDDALYWKAWALYNQSRFARAIKTTSELLNNTPESDLADDALFCKGMSYEYLKTGGFLGLGVKKHFIEAAECFYNLIAMYPQSKLIPNSYYHLGYNYERLKDKQAAIKAYLVIINDYANSSVAFKAGQRLKALGAYPADSQEPGRHE